MQVSPVANPIHAQSVLSCVNNAVGALPVVSAVGSAPAGVRLASSVNVVVETVDIFNSAPLVRPYTLYAVAPVTAVHERLMGALVESVPAPVVVTSPHARVSPALFFAEMR